MENKKSRRLLQLLVFLAMALTIKWLVDSAAAFQVLGGGVFVISLFGAYQSWLKRKEKIKRQKGDNITGSIELFAFLLISTGIGVATNYTMAFTVLSSGIFVIWLFSAYRHWVKVS